MSTTFGLCVTLKRGYDYTMQPQEAIELLRKGREGVLEWNRRRPEKDFSFTGLDLSGAYMRRADLSYCNLDRCNLERADLSSAYLRFATFRGANCRRMQMIEADGMWSFWNHADLREATLIGSEMSATDLEGADLRGADLGGVKLGRSRLDRVRLNGARFVHTIIAGDMSKVEGLNEIVHDGPSHIAVDTILRFTNGIPEEFLRGCGVSDEEIQHFRSRLRNPISFYTCFISYSEADDRFATRLHNDLQAAGIRCWRWKPDARTGRELWSEIDDAIRIHEKLILVASKSSLTSPAVHRELERALLQEDERVKRKLKGENVDVDVLFPVRIDNYIFDGWQHPRKADVVKKVVADASEWDTDPEKYQAVLRKLIADLKVGSQA
jgi:hypothetical protein